MSRYLQTHFMFPLLLRRGGLRFPHSACISHHYKRQCEPFFPSSFSLTVSPGQAAATGQHYTPGAMAWQGVSILPADSRAPWDGARAAQLIQTRGDFLQTTHTGTAKCHGQEECQSTVYSTQSFLCTLRRIIQVCLRSPGSLQ